MKTTLLAYRNNQTYEVLSESILKAANTIAKSYGSELLVKIFEAGTEFDTIKTWIKSLSPEREICKYITDGTVRDQFKALGIQCGYCSFLNLGFNNDRFTHMDLSTLYSTCYARLVEKLQPDIWVIEPNNITDYYPLSQTRPTDKYKEPTKEEREWYVEKFKSFIPSNQIIVVGTRGLLGTLKDKKVVLIAHHHAFDRYYNGLSCFGEGSIHLNTYPASFMQELVSIIETRDLISVDLIEMIRGNLEGIARGERDRN